MAEEIQFALPNRLTPALREILGFMCFQVGPFAAAYRIAGLFVDSEGSPLKSRAEDEQAFMLHRFLVHWAKAGDDWRVSMDLEMENVIALARQLTADAAATSVEGSGND